MANFSFSASTWLQVLGVTRGLPLADVLWRTVARRGRYPVPQGVAPAGCRDDDDDARSSETDRAPGTASSACVLGVSDVREGGRPAAAAVSASR